MIENGCVIYNKLFSLGYKAERPIIDFRYEIRREKLLHFRDNDVFLINAYL